MRLSIIIIMLFGIILTPTSAQSDCVPASGEPITLGAVFPQDFLLLDDSNNAYSAVLAVTELYNQCNEGARPIEWQLESATTYDDAIEAMERFNENNVPIVIGSGMESVSEGLNDAATTHEIVFWDVTERPRQMPSDWSFTLRPSNAILGNRTAEFIQTEVVNMVLDEPLRLALVVEDTLHANMMADAVREQLGDVIVVDETIARPSDIAVNIRETDANVLLLISISGDANSLWFAMRQADANVDAWMMLGQEELTLTNHYADDLDTTGVMIIGSQHIAVESVEQAISQEWYTLFLQAYRDLSDDAPDTEVLSAAVGTHHLLVSVLSQVSSDITSEAVRDIMQNSSGIDLFNMTDTLPLAVRQQQENGYCLLAPASFRTCDAPMQAFPTWRQRALDNQ